MADFQTFWEMGGYGVYIWPAYGLAGVLLLFLGVQAALRLRAARTKEHAHDA